MITSQRYSKQPIKPSVIARYHIQPNNPPMRLKGNYLISPSHNAHSNLSLRPLPIPASSARPKMQRANTPFPGPPGQLQHVVVPKIRPDM